MDPWSFEVQGRFDELTVDSRALRGNPLGDPHERPLWVYLPPGYDDDPSARDAALAALPALAIAPRPPFTVPPEHSLIVDAAHVVVSSSEARAGSTEWMSPAARAFDRRTGAWSDPARYEQWLRDGGADRGIKG